MRASYTAQHRTATRSGELSCWESLLFVGSICRHGLCNRTPGRIRELHPTVNRKARPNGMSLVCILLSPRLILPEVSDVNQRFSVLVVDWISAVTLSLMSHGVTWCHVLFAVKDVYIVLYSNLFINIQCCRITAKSKQGHRKVWPPQ